MAAGAPWVVLATLIVVTGLTSTLDLIGDLQDRSEAGYGDSYVYYDVQHFVRTGVLYRPASEPPYNPTLYGPAMYAVLSLPARAGVVLVPQFLLRLTTLAFFLGCVAAAMSITRRLTRRRRLAWAAGLLLLTTGLFVGSQALLRGDFMGACLSLLAVRVLLMRQRWAPGVAGLLAGSAFLFKLTFLAVSAAGVLWLLWRRRVRQALLYGTACALAGIGGHLLFLLAQPELLQHLATLTKPVIDEAGANRVTVTLVREPLFLLGVAGLAIVFFRRRTYWLLVAVAAVFSLILARLAVRQAGAAINYFFEAALLLAPPAAWALVKLYQEWKDRPVTSLAVAGFALLYLLYPAMYQLGDSVARFRVKMDRERDRRIAAFQRAIANRYLFSQAPDYALVTPRTPVVTEPYLIRYLEKMGRYDTKPLADQLRAGEFEAVLTRTTPVSHRGVEMLSPRFQAAIEQAYTPLCTFGITVVHQRRVGADPSLSDELQKAGCVPVSLSNGK